MNFPIHQFMNCKMSFKVFKMKKQGLKCFLKWQIRNNTPLKRGCKRLSGLYAALQIRELENSWFCFFDVTNKLFLGKRQTLPEGVQKRILRENWNTFSSIIFCGRGVLNRTAIIALVHEQHISNSNRIALHYNATDQKWINN